MGFTAFLKQGNMMLKCIGLALCLFVRDMPQFVAFDSLSSVTFERYYFAAGRALALIVILVLVYTAYSKKTASARRASFWLAIPAILADTAGLMLIEFGGSDVAIVGSVLLGIGQSTLVIAWSLWMLTRKPAEIVYTLAGAFIIAGCLELMSAFMVSYAAQALSVVLPALSCIALLAPTKGSPNLTDSFTESGLPQPWGSAVPTGRERSVQHALLLVILFGYSFVFRQLTDVWMANSTNETLFVFQICGSIGTMAASLVALSVVTLRRPFNDSSLITAFITFLLVLTLYLSGVFTGIASAIYLVLLFVMRKMLLLLPVYKAEELPTLKGRIVFVCVAMFCVELGNLAKNLCGGVCDMFGLPYDTISTVIVLVFLVFSMVAELAFLYRGGQRAEDASTKATQLEQAQEAREAALDAMQADWKLTAREREVIELLCQGRNAEYISLQLVIAHSTAKSHIAHIYQKAGFNSQQKLMDELERRMQQ